MVARAEPTVNSWRQDRPRSRGGQKLVALVVRQLANESPAAGSCCRVQDAEQRGLTSGNSGAFADWPMCAQACRVRWPVSCVHRRRSALACVPRESCVPCDPCRNRVCRPPYSQKTNFPLYFIFITSPTQETPLLVASQPPAPLHPCRAPSPTHRAPRGCSVVAWAYFILRARPLARPRRC